jgi:hypothetical protein
VWVVLLWWVHDEPIEEYRLRATGLGRGLGGHKCPPHVVVDGAWGFYTCEERFLEDRHVSAGWVGGFPPPIPMSGALSAYEGNDAARGEIRVARPVASFVQ